MFIRVISIAFLILFGFSSSASAGVLCLESDGTTIKTRKKKKCTNKGGTVIESLSQLRGERPVLCYGTTAVAGTDITIKNFGGHATTNVTVVRQNVGQYEIVCEGNYTGLSGVDDVTMIVTMDDTESFDTASNSSDFGTVSETEIQTNVFTWRTDTATQTERAFAFLILGSVN